MTTKHALVTGATGAIGPALVTLLLGNGYSVRTYSRVAPSPNLFSPDVETIQGDIHDHAALAEALRDIDTVFHLAALLHIEHPASEILPRYHEINVAGTQNVVQQSVKAGVHRFVYFSTVKVYGIQQRRPVTEDILPQPATLYAQTKFQGEQVVKSAGDMETVVLRLSAVYGARLRGSWERMISAITKGWFIPVGTLQNQRSLTYVDDVARAAQFIAEQPNTAGGTFNVVGHDAVTMREILSAIYGALDKPMPTVRIPALAASAGIQMLETISALTGKSFPLNGEAIQQLITDEVYSGAKLRNLGWEAFTPLEQGWKQAIRELIKP